MLLLSFVDIFSRKIDSVHATVSLKKKSFVSPKIVVEQHQVRVATPNANAPRRRLPLSLPVSFPSSVSAFSSDDTLRFLCLFCIVPEMHLFVHKPAWGRFSLNLHSGASLCIGNSERIHVPGGRNHQCPV